MIRSPNTAVFSSFSRDEEERLLAFKKETFYFTGEDFANFNRWQEFFNLFFIYHLRSDHEGTTVAQRRDMDPAAITLYMPSLFSRMKGEDLFTGRKMVLDPQFVADLDWFKEREMILSLFHFDEERARIVQSKASFVIPMKQADFFKKVKKLQEADPAYERVPYLLFLISILLVKKDRFSSAKLFDPFRIEELEKAHLYYQKFADAIV